jgi:hypothetical protein
MEKIKSKNEKINLVVIIPFLFITVFFSIMFLKYPKKLKSDAENRLLAEKPTLEYESINSFPADFEKYYNDQFPFRENFLKMFSRLQLSLGKIKVRDLYIANGFLLPREYLYPKKDISISAKKAAELMSFVRSAGKKGAYISLPYKTSVYNYLLPKYLQSDTGELNYEHFTSELGPDIKTCDAFRCFNGENHSSIEEYFFKADLHWNAKGAGAAFKYIMKWLYDEEFINEPFYKELAFEYTYKSAKYLGDLNRRFSFLFPLSENIPVFKDTVEPVKYYLTYNSEDYTLDRSAIIDQTLEPGFESYNSVYSNNIGYYKMVNDNSLLDANVLVIKDSMENAMTDMISKTFKVSEIVDIRSLEDIGLYQVISDSNADLVLLMYHQNNVTGNMFDFK